MHYTYRVIELKFMVIYWLLIEIAFYIWSASSISLLVHREIEVYWETTFSCYSIYIFYVCMTIKRKKLINIFVFGQRVIFFSFFFHLEQNLFTLKHCNFSKIYIFYTTNEIYVEIVTIRLMIEWFVRRPVTLSL